MYWVSKFKDMPVSMATDINSAASTPFRQEVPDILGTAGLITH